MLSRKKFHSPFDGLFSRYGTQEYQGRWVKRDCVARGTDNSIKILKYLRNQDSSVVRPLFIDPVVNGSNPISSSSPTWSEETPTQVQKSPSLTTSSGPDCPKLARHTP